jgi:hypothetical protein
MAKPLRTRLAFQRVRDELLAQPKSGRAFVANQFELELIGIDYDGWIEDLAHQVHDGRYSPGPIEYCNAPKGAGLVRPGARLQIADRVVYTAAVGACLPRINSATRWSQKRIDFAPRINPNGLSKRHWLLAPFVGWDEWRQESLSKLAMKKTNCVLTADIAGYFENISIQMLRSDLLRIGCRDEPVSIITQCLNHWAPADDRGLPQGVLASDVLAKLYLEAFDRRLKSEGFRHVRYADDMRVFCRSEREARRALVFITELLRDRGLTLQSAKTRIRPADSLESEFEGAVPAIQALNRDYIDEALIAGVMQADPSVPVSVLDDLANAAPDEMNPKVIRRAFRKFVMKPDSPDKSMRRYLLRRLAALQSDFAVEYCSDLIIDQPETSTEVLRYFEDLEDPRRFEDVLIKVLKTPDLSMYPYQQYLALNWLWRNSTKLRIRTLNVVRNLSLDGNSPDYVRAVGYALLGRFGSHSDLERIAGLFSKASDPLERAQLLCSLSRLEKGRRNALLGRVKGERPWVGRAVRLVRSA